MCITNNAMPVFVTLTVIVYRQYYCAFWFLNTFVPEMCRFLVQSPFLFSSFFFYWLLYGEDVRIVSDSECIFIAILVYYSNDALKHVLSRGHILSEMSCGIVIKVMSWVWAPLIAYRVFWLWWRSSILTRSRWMFFMFVNVSTRAQTPLRSSTHNQWRVPLIVEKNALFKILFVHLKDPLNWIILTIFKAIAQDKLVAGDGWNSYDQVRMSIEESFQPIYLIHICTQL